MADLSVAAVCSPEGSLSTALLTDCLQVQEVAEEELIPCINDDALMNILMAVLFFLHTHLFPPVAISSACLRFEGYLSFHGNFEKLPPSERFISHGVFVPQIPLAHPPHPAPPSPAIL